MFVEPVSAVGTAASGVRPPNLQDDFSGETSLPASFVGPDAESFRTAPASGPFSTGFDITARIELLIEEIEWENDRLLITPRNSSSTSEEFQTEGEAAAGAQSVREKLATDPTLALLVQANLSPGAVLSLLGGDFGAN